MIVFVLTYLRSRKIPPFKVELVHQRKDTEYDIEFGQLEDPNDGWGSYVDEGIFIYLPDGTQWFASTPRMEDEWNTEE